MPVEVASKRRKVKRPDAVVIDVTSRGPEPWVRFSPFCPHGGVPVPLSPGVTSESVEGLWQALKVFESAGVDPAKLAVTSMKGLKRTVRRFGRVRGHRAGLTGEHLLDYRTARREIYLPAYRWVLDHRVRAEVEQLHELAQSSDVVLLDYTTNGDVEDASTPLSHAALLADHLRRLTAPAS
ncbi:DUF6939 family protein [Lentzea jiangxiensis]|uniref:Uncharacterized protein n=1 Tax=Lentzea jiangxiensis TaxID=641025 RepID=A0A1H0R7S2_9PSEU|nr:hypothetical protein [Lentzea jiangxiensis]SDP25602.1 hypothetical protein SAMN05421507_106201 [Lentzea jiangxiensis]